MTKAQDWDIIDGDYLIGEAGELFNDLFPICRSITGNGVRHTLHRLREITPFDIQEIPTGTVCYDWTVPEEWNINDAFIADSAGNRMVSFQDNNIHVVSYSTAIDKKVSFQELKSHLHYLPDMPDAIPYRTSYYNRDWGFCLTYNQFKQLDPDAMYHVYINASHTNGSLTYGEKLMRGTSGEEYLISTYCCHPSLANDNLSGPILWTLLLKILKTKSTRHSYRFVILPETIGAIAYLHRNALAMEHITGGFIPTTVAGPGQFGYKHTFAEDSIIDRVAKRTFYEQDVPFISYPFDIHGSDERHYSAPYWRIPIGTISKDKYYEYDYYHTSHDNLDFVKPEYLVESLKLYLLTIEKLEMNLTYESLSPHSEPMLGKRGLYPKVGGSIKQKVANLDQSHRDRAYTISVDNSLYGNELDATNWLMFLSDGKMTLLDIAEKTDLPMKKLYETAEKLVLHKLLRRIDTKVLS